jgi:hypothetical protein
MLPDCGEIAFCANCRCNCFTISIHITKAVEFNRYLKQLGLKYFYEIVQFKAKYKNKFEFTIPLEVKYFD